MISKGNEGQNVFLKRIFRGQMNDNEFSGVLEVLRRTSSLQNLSLNFSAHVILLKRTVNFILLEYYRQEFITVKFGLEETERFKEPQASLSIVGPFFRNSK